MVAYFYGLQICAHFLCRVNDACLSGPILCGENIWGRCFRQFLTECIDFFLVQNCKCVPVETVLLFCFQVLQLQHHLSGVTLVPPKVDPAGKACSYFLNVEEEWQWGKDSQNSEFTSKCPPVTLGMSALDEWETFKKFPALIRDKLSHSTHLWGHPALRS